MNTRNIERLQALRERTQHFRLQQDGPARAYYGVKLEADAAALLDDEAAGLTPDEIAFVEVVAKIAQGEDVQLPEFPTEIRAARLAEPARNAPMPDRIAGLLSQPERVELAEASKSVPEHDRDRLAGLLRMEQASDTGMKLLTEPERAAARLHLDREAERAHVARLSTEARASGDRLAAIGNAPTPTGPGAPHLRGF